MKGPPPGEVALLAAGRALARFAGLSLTAGLGPTLRQAIAAAAADRDLTPSALMEAVAAGQAEALSALAEHAVVGETAFWRHPEALLALAAELAGRPGPVSLWSAGCATGEEPYSLAMALAEAGRDLGGDRILATDLAAGAIARARAGLYPARALRKLPRALAARWFQIDDRGAAVAGPLAAPVTFACHNLLDPPPGGPFDAVLCRNVVIYFEPEVARAALARVAAALAPGGLLVLGPIELPLADGLPLEWVERSGATLLRRVGSAAVPS